ncbi:MAG TPA: hypothetical protein VFC24_07835 [Casimicrobiaceae bacterium]|nr:hypothetical protein [Casimicrobiaceae bacterium]
MRFDWHELSVSTRRAGAVGVIALVVAVVGGWFDPDAFFEAWLVTWVFIVGLALGGMMIVMIHELTGGKWGLVLRPPLEAAMLSLPLVALLGIPLLFGLSHLFEWARPEAVDARYVLRAKHWFLNVPGFVVRNIAWLAIWSGFAMALARRLRTGDTATRKQIAVAALIVYFLTVTLFAYDWIASLVPDWNSTAIGVRLGAAQFLAAFAFTLCLAHFQDASTTAMSEATRHDLQDFGNLLLTFCMFWAYIAYTQFFIVWGEDLPREIAWYWPRVRTSWQWLALAVLAIEFVVPFVAMLFRALKRDSRRLTLVAAIVLAGAWLDCLWLITPSLHPGGFTVHWLHFVALLAEGGLWLAFVLATMRQLPTPITAPESNASDKANAHG